MGQKGRVKVFSSRGWARGKTRGEYRYEAYEVKTQREYVDCSSGRLDLKVCPSDLVTMEFV